MPSPARPARAPARPRPLPGHGRLNVTPDSFSDGGEFLDPDAAVAHGLAMVADGADLVDVGGESTRPGAQRVDAAGGAAPGAAGRARAGRRRSRRSASTRCAPRSPRPPLEAGAALVNDVSGGLADEAMAAHRGRAGRAVRRHALARAQRRHGHPRGLRRRGRRGRRGAGRPGSTPGPRRGSTSTASSSTRGSGSPRTPTHNWSLLAHLDAWVGSAARCWSAPRARDSSARCWPAPTAAPAGRCARGRDRRPCRCWPRSRGVGGPGARGTRHPRRRRGGRRCPGRLGGWAAP